MIVGHRTKKVFLLLVEILGIVPSCVQPLNKKTVKLVRLDNSELGRQGLVIVPMPHHLEGLVDETPDKPAAFLFAVLKSLQCSLSANRV